MQDSAIRKRYRAVEIGHAVDYRIRYRFAMTPSPEFVAVRNGAQAIARIDDLIELVRSHPSQFSDYAMTRLGDVPKGDEDWQHFSDTDLRGGCAAMRIPSATAGARRNRRPCRDADAGRNPSTAADTA